MKGKVFLLLALSLSAVGVSYADPSYPPLNNICDANPSANSGDNNCNIMGVSQDFCDLVAGNFVPATNGTQSTCNALRRQLNALFFTRQGGGDFSADIVCDSVGGFGAGVNNCGIKNGSKALCDWVNGVGGHWSADGQTEVASCSTDRFTLDRLLMSSIPQQPLFYYPTVTEYPFQF